MSHALSHSPHVHHPRELSREEQTRTIKGGSTEGSTPNEQRSCSPFTSRCHLPSTSDYPESCSTSASRLTRDCSPLASRGCSHLSSTPPRGCPLSANRGCSHQASTRMGGDCPPSLSSPRPAHSRWAPPWAGRATRPGLLTLGEQLASGVLALGERPPWAGLAASPRGAR